MAQNRRPQTRKNNRIWIPIVIVLVLAGVGGYYFWSSARQAKTASAAAAKPAYYTATVRRGNIALSATGSGTLTASQSSQLGFSTSGTVAQLNAQVGEQVKQGQVLAQLDNTDQLQAGVNSAQQNLIAAQQTLQNYQQSASANLGNAEMAVINDQKAVTDAQSALIQPGMQRCDQTTLDAYYQNYVSLQNQLNALGTSSTDSNYYLHTILPMKNKVAQALAAYQWCEGFTQYELDASHAKLDVAKAKLQQDQTTLATLQKNSGLDPITLAQDENKVATAQAALDTANENLAGGTIKAPFDGTIIAVTGSAGSTVSISGSNASSGSSSSTGSSTSSGSTSTGSTGSAASNTASTSSTTSTGSSASSASITIADLAHPQVQFAIDETDMDKVAMGEQAQVVLDAYPNRTFTGKVVMINPSLVTSSNVSTVQGLIQLDLSKETNIPVLSQGMNATITLVRAQANNVLLVPVQAVRDLGGGSYGVFVVGPGGQLQLKIVQIGLQDVTDVEIKSGLNAGDVVSTGSSQTVPSQSNLNSNSQ